ncbi:MAG: DUF45 domain-containing protein [Lachnospiraceae bacterium]|nr:DUF45 domain-containing protein [Lachnospiraceae bacterium]
MEKITYRLVRSDRRTLAVEIKDGELLVRAPRRTSKGAIDRFVLEHRDWIEAHLTRARERQQVAATTDKLTEAALAELTLKAREVIAKRVALYAPQVGVTYGRITIRHQKTRWGSCTAEGNLNFNCLLLLAPLEVLDSVVVHELCHRKEMNHSQRFYAEVLRVYPDYRKWNRWLKDHGHELMARLPG